MRIVHDWPRPHSELPEVTGASFLQQHTDTLFALGLRQRLVGRSAFCYRPAGVSGLPVVPRAATRVRWRAFGLIAARLGAWSALGSSGIRLGPRLSGVFPCIRCPLPQSPYGIMENVALLGALLGVSEAATRLATEGLGRGWWCPALPGLAAPAGGCA